MDIYQDIQQGAVADQVVLGSEMNNLFTWLETDFNDGKNYILHYVTAREAFNIFKAVEADEPGENHEKYRNYLINKPKYNPDIDIEGASEELKGLFWETY